MSGFYVNFGLPKIEEFARRHGFVSATWKHEVLADLLFQDRLSVEKSINYKNPKATVWHCVGRRVSISCVSDQYLDDALFCIGLVAGPEKGGPRARGRVIEVAGPWSIHTMGRRPRPAITVTDHLLKCYGAETVEPTRSLNSPFAGLGDLVQRHLDSAPPKSRSGQSASSDIAADERVKSQQVTVPDAPGFVPMSPPADAMPAPPAGHRFSGSTVLPDAYAASTQPGDPVEGARWVAATEASDRIQSGPLDVDPVREERDEVLQDEGILHDQDDRHDVLLAAKAEIQRLQESDSIALESIAEEIRQGPISPAILPDITASWRGLAIQLLVRDAPPLDGLLSVPDPRDARRQRIIKLEAELARIQSSLQDIPSDEALAEADQRSNTVADLGSRIAALPPAMLQIGGLVQLETLLQVLAGDMTRSIPPWALGLASSDEITVERVLREPEMQVQLLEACAWIERRFAGAPPSRLRELMAPAGIADSSSAAVALDAAWNRASAMAVDLGDLPDACRSLLNACAVGDAPRVVGALREWRDALHPDAFGGMLAAALSNASVTGVELPDVDLLAGLRSEDRENLRDLRSFERAMRHLRRPLPNLEPTTSPVSTRRGEAPAARVLEFGHPVTNEQGRLTVPALFVPPPSPGSIFAQVDMPIRIVADAPIGVDLTVNVHSAPISAVPRDSVLPPALRLVGPPGGQSLEWLVPGNAARWREQDSGRYSREEVLSVPITLGASSELRDGKAALVLRLASGEASNSLRFERFVDQLPNYGTGTGLGDAQASELVRTRPLGAQVQHSKLEGVVGEGRHSFMVVAPRRFGKTTLFKHLCEHAHQSGHLVIAVSLERDVAPDQGTRSFWAEVKRSLEQKFHVAPAFGDTLPYSLTDATAWASVRSLVAGRGFNSVVVLIDEAQVLAPRTGIPRFGNQLKSFVEMVLSEPSAGQPVVQVGLFGTVDLSVRLGQNCRDFLLTYGAQHHDFDETSLARYLRQIGQGSIESSRAARLELARWTNNLRTLPIVFEGIRARLVREQRQFMLDLDVAACIKDMLRSDGHLPEEVWNYARAELSHRDEPWDPIDAFPLAVAWSRAEVAHLSEAERLKASLSWLNGELDATGVAATVPLDRAKAALGDLRARGVIRDDGEFYRPLLRELLRRKFAVLRDNPESQLALYRLAVDSVAWPDALEERGRGGQAKVYLVDRGERASAYRTCELDSDDARRRFARTCAALRTLRDRRTRLPGDDHLPRVSEAGFRTDDPSQGVIVYDWVEGDMFEPLWGRLPAQGRCHVVKQVASAIAALHARDVLHCDVAPRNIIVNSKLEATLIDFGLARPADTPSHTRLPKDPFKAPGRCP